MRRVYSVLRYGNRMVTSYFTPLFDVWTVLYPALCLTYARSAGHSVVSSLFCTRAEGDQLGGIIYNTGIMTACSVLVRYGNGARNWQICGGKAEIPPVTDCHRPDRLARLLERVALLSFFSPLFPPPLLPSPISLPSFPPSRLCCNSKSPSPSINSSLQPRCIDLRLLQPAHRSPDYTNPAVAVWPSGRWGP